MELFETLRPLLAPAERALQAFGPLLAVIAGSLVAWTLARRMLVPRFGGGSEGRIGSQLLLVALVGAANVAVLLVLPVSESTRGQLLSLFGLLVTAVIGLASTTFVANAMGGLMLRAVGNFRTGDFVRVADQFGRVTERGLFHTEIQTEDRDLTTFPNLVLVTQPVTVVRASGTIVSAELSLGYDVPHGTAEPLLLRAAGDAGLADPFVYVTELGDFAVTYRVAGFLAEAKTLLSVRSRLREQILDVLHGAGVEIASPTIMDQRRIGDRPILPSREGPVIAAAPSQTSPEALVFDKADHAEQLEGLKRALGRVEAEIQEIETQFGQLAESDPRHATVESQLAHLRRHRDDLGRAVEAMKSHHAD